MQLQIFGLSLSNYIPGQTASGDRFFRAIAPRVSTYLLEYISMAVNSQDW